ncbi:MAG: hypothetical protein KAH38_02225, partial [Candidatus Hydrogenedentes bacterium]|nr:hypothetical protein [Candidatus Hydrogenedentota bacterium]
FEMNTAIAFRCFAEHKVDIALVEVGMGGRFDSTNIVEPIACSITTIDYDHTLYLGETLEKIAFEKAGIIKENVPVVVGDVAAAPMRVIEAQAQRMKSVLYHLNEEYHVVPGGDALHPTISYQGQGFDIGDTPIGLAGVHQVYNAAVAITLASLIRSRFTGITPSVICEALKTVSWPGRLEQVMDMPPVIIDVAHNPAGCRALADTLPQCVTVFSVSSDKDAAGMIDILAPISYPLILTEYAGGRSLALDKLESLAVHHPYQRSATLQEAIQKGLQFATPEKPLLITGSIYAVGEARRFLLSYANARSVVF